jgi:hypothetical protein
VSPDLRVVAELIHEIDHALDRIEAAMDRALGPDTDGRQS